MCPQQPTSPQLLLNPWDQPLLYPRRCLAGAEQSPDALGAFFLLFPLVALQIEANHENSQKILSPNKVSLDPIPSFTHIHYALIHDETGL